MDYAIPIILLAAAIVIVLLIKTIKGIIQTVFYVLLIIVIVTGVFSFLLIRDTRAVIYGNQGQRNYYLLSEQKNIVYGFTIEGTNLSTAEPLPEDRISEIGQLVQDKKYKEVLGTDNRLIIVNRDRMQINRTMTIEDMILSRLKDAKLAEFAIYLSGSVAKDPSFLFNEYRKGNLLIYPETLSMQIAKFFSGGYGK